MYEVNIYPLHFTFIHLLGTSYQVRASSGRNSRQTCENPKPPFVLKTLKPKNRIASREQGFEQKVTSECGAACCEQGYRKNQLKSGWAGSESGLMTHWPDAPTPPLVSI